MMGISQFDYIEYAKEHLPKTELQTLYTLPPTTYEKINRSLNRLDNSDIREQLENSDKELKDYAMEALRNILQNPKAVHALRSIPKHMRLKVELIKKTDSKTRKAIRSEIYFKSLKSELLLHLAKTTNQVKEILGLTQEDVHKIHHKELRKKEAYRKSNIIDIPESSRRSKASSASIKIFDRLVLSHKTPIHTAGTKISRKKTQHDDIFSSTAHQQIHSIYLLNSSSNLVFLPYWIEKQVNNLTLPQINIDRDDESKNRIFFNMVLEDDLLIYPETKAFQKRSYKKMASKKKKQPRMKKSGNKNKKLQKCRQCA